MRTRRNPLLIKYINDKYCVGEIISKRFYLLSYWTDVDDAIKHYQDIKKEEKESTIP